MRAIEHKDLRTGLLRFSNQRRLVALLTRIPLDADIELRRWEPLIQRTSDLTVAFNQKLLGGITRTSVS